MRAAFAVAYLLAAELGHFLSFSGNFASFWPPSGLYLATLLLAPRRDWPGYVVAAVGANLISDVAFHGKAVPVAIAFAVGNTVEALVGAWLLLRLTGGEFHIARLRHTLAFCGVAALVAMPVGAVAGAATVTAAFGGSFATVWATWWISGLIGAVVVAPMVLKAFGPGTPFVGPVRPWSAVEATVLLTGLAAFTEFLFGWQTRPMVWLVTPFLLWAALRFDVKGVVAAVPIVAALAVWNTAHGYGPLAAFPIDRRMLALQVFLTVLAFSFLIVGAVVRERGDNARAVTASDHRYRDLFDNMEELVACFGPRAEFLYANRACCEALGRTEAELRTLTTHDVLHPDDYPSCAAAHARLLQGEAFEGLVFRIVTRSGEELIVEGGSNPQFDEAGRVVAVRAIYRDVTAQRAAAVELRRLQDELQARVNELEAALTQVKELEGLLPICSWCKKVRDDGDHWQEIEKYISSHTRAHFTHGVCPGCYEEQMEACRSTPPPPARGVTPPGLSASR